jgi:large subunit ribosomal protein L24e
MKRNPRKVKWTKSFRRAAGKEMTIDSTLEFEKRRNVPVRYDRELMATTLKAMKRIQEIKAKRERVFTMKRYFICFFIQRFVGCWWDTDNFWYRLQGKKEKEKADTIKMVQKNIELIDTPAIKQKMLEKKLKATESSRQEMDLS